MSKHFVFDRNGLVFCARLFEVVGSVLERIVFLNVSWLQLLPHVRGGVVVGEVLVVLDLELRHRHQYPFHSFRFWFHLDRIGVDSFLSLTVGVNALAECVWGRVLLLMKVQGDLVYVVTADVVRLVLDGQYFRWREH